jgi:anti-sigma28 factor (negative regulator of flagellin synthesis)
MINPVSNNFTNANTLVSDNTKNQATVDTNVSDLPRKEIVNKLDGMDLTIKDQVAKLADGPPINRSMVDEIKSKVEQGRYPIDLDLVTAKMFASFQEAKG